LHNGNQKGVMIPHKLHRKHTTRR